MFLGRFTGSYVDFCGKCLGCSTKLNIKSPTYKGIFECTCAVCGTMQQVYPEHKRIDKYTYDE